MPIDNVAALPLYAGIRLIAGSVNQGAFPSRNQVGRMTSGVSA